MHRAQRNQLLRALKRFILFLIAVLGTVFVLYINLPPDEVNGHLAKNTDLSFLKGLKEEKALLQGYAEWQFRNYYVVKYADSKPLGVTLVGYPFQKWQVHKRH